MKHAAFVICALACSPLASASVLWNEMSGGDLSDNRLAPTSLALLPGDNELFGIMSGERDGGGFDVDYFTVTIPAGYQLSQVMLDHYDSFDAVAFMAIQPGSIFPDDPDTVDPGDLLGWTHFGTLQLGQDLLTTMSITTARFTPPLTGTHYTFWVQQLDDYTDWTGRFVVTEIPAPGVAYSFLCACVPLCRRRRRGPVIPRQLLPQS